MKRSSPAKPAMKFATSSRPCIDSAASCSAAIQPSVRASNVAMSAAVSSRPIAPFRYVGGFLGGEAQVGGPDLHQLAARPQARQRQRRIGPAREHEVRTLGQMVEEVGQPVLNVVAIDDVEVVEDENDIPVDAVQLVDERREHGFRRRVRRIQERACVRAEAGHRRLERREDVRPEQRRIVVALVEREPRHRGAVVGDRAAATP